MSTANPSVSLAVGTTRHPFRAALPRRVLRRLPQFEPEVQARIAAAEAQRLAPEPAEPARRPVVLLRDVRDFLLAYIACFAAVSAFIS